MTRKHDDVVDATPQQMMDRTRDAAATLAAQLPPYPDEEPDVNTEDYFDWLLSQVREQYPDVLLDELRMLRLAKRKDYGAQTDHLANYRRSERIGIPAWTNIILRTMEKWARVETLTARGGKAHNESLDDSLRDIGIMALLAIQAYRADPKPMLTQQMHEALLEVAHEEASPIEPLDLARSTGIPDTGVRVTTGEASQASVRPMTDAELARAYRNAPAEPLPGVARNDDGELVIQ